MTPYADLMTYQRQTEALSQISGRLEWDRETMMPNGAAPQRAEECAAMSAIIHARRTSAQLGDWLEEVEDSALDEVGQAMMRRMRRDYARNTKLPADLVSELARVTSLAQGQWAEARASEDVAAFLPVLDTILKLRQQEADALSGGGDRYNALLDDYEPFTDAAELEAMFNTMRPVLVDVRNAASERPAPKQITGQFDPALQMKLAQDLAVTFGYDLNHGRLDKAVHPFSSGQGMDNRITTRTEADNPFNCLYSTIHEVGHACYEQNVDRAYLLTPLGRGVSMGVHESQSRIYENQLGRSRAFTEWLYGRMVDVFGDFGINSADEFYRTVNRLNQGFIRTEADEVQYNLHVMLRFDLERAMIAGDLQVADLETAWNDRFAADFGIAVDKSSNGMLQDVHWSIGLFGYFPTYSLGNVYAGCLYDALRNSVSNLDDQLAQGNLTGATDWLKQNVQRHGALLKPKEVIENATEKPISAEPLLGYIKNKFATIYR